jgi:hypothetical protein
MVATERTRREIVEASPHEKWLARPFDDPNGQEIITLSKVELYRGLDCDGVLTPPPATGALYETTATAGLNVRVAPNTSAERVGSLPLGTQVRAVVHDASWLRIVEGEHAGRYVASAYARPM